MAIDYSRRAPDYDTVRADDATDRSFWLRGLLEVGEIQPGERVLDIGAGTGRFSALLQATNPVVAFDRSAEMLAVARAKGAFPCVRGDGHALPFRGGAVDISLLVMVLQHVTDLGAVLREGARVSRRIVIATVNLERRSPTILEEAFPSLLEVDRARFPRIDAVVAHLDSLGFERIRVEERPYRRKLTVQQQLDRVRGRYLSTFDLLPPGEFERGVQFLEREMPRRFGDRFEVRSKITFLAGTR